MIGTVAYKAIPLTVGLLQSLGTLKGASPLQQAGHSVITLVAAVLENLRNLGFKLYTSVRALPGQISSCENLLAFVTYSICRTAEKQPLSIG